MPCSDAEKRERRPFGRSPILLPISQRVHADAERLRELRLGEPDEASERGYVTRLQLATDDSLPLASTKRALEVLSSELTISFHDFRSAYSR